MHTTRSTEPVQKRRKLNNKHIPGDDFHACNVLADRVSLKPEMNIGMFSRSKISHPVAGRDLPDLTFSRIGFLSNKERLHDRKTKISCEENREHQEAVRNQLADFMQKLGGINPKHNVEERLRSANSPVGTCERSSEGTTDSRLKTSNVNTSTKNKAASGHSA